MLPEAPNPIAILELLQAYVAPVGVLEKLLAATVVPGHTVILAGTFTVGLGLTVTVCVVETAPHSLESFKVIV